MADDEVIFNNIAAKESDSWGSIITITLARSGGKGTKLLGPVTTV